MITRHMGKAIFQYKLFSTATEWLPRIPKRPVECDISIPQHAVVGGLHTVIGSLVGNADVSFVEAASSNLHANITNALQSKRVQSGLQNLNLDSITLLQARLDAQSDGETSLTDEILQRWDKKETEEYFKRASSQNEGEFIVLNYIRSSIAKTNTSSNNTWKGLFTGSQKAMKSKACALSH